MGLGDRIWPRDPSLCLLKGGAEAISLASAGILHGTGQTGLGGEWSDFTGWKGEKQTARCERQPGRSACSRLGQLNTMGLIFLTV